GGVVEVVHVPHGAGRIALDVVINALDEAEVLGAPGLQVLPAQEADRAHGGGGAGSNVAVAFVGRIANAVQELLGFPHGDFGNIQAGHLAALESHHLPADHRGV